MKNVPSTQTNYIFKYNFMVFWNLKKKLLKIHLYSESRVRDKIRIRIMDRVTLNMAPTAS